jgi:hypothetical protein
MNKEIRMKKSAILLMGLALLALAARTLWADKEKKVDNRVFELRIYHAAEGKMKALHARFRDHTCLWFPG